VSKRCVRVVTRGKTSWETSVVNGEANLPVSPRPRRCGGGHMPIHGIELVPFRPPTSVKGDVARQAW